jgi:hypothetical protein
VAGWDSSACLNEREVEQVTAEGAARPIVFETGDGGEYPVSLTVTHYSIEEDYIHGVVPQRCKAATLSRYQPL